MNSAFQRFMAVLVIYLSFLLATDVLTNDVIWGFFGGWLAHVVWELVNAHAKEEGWWPSL